MSETWSKIKSSFQEHPWLWAAGVFVVGVLIIYYLFRKPAAAPSGTSDVQAYYQAATAATASGNQLQATQVAAAASTQASNNALTATLAAIAGNNLAAQEQTKQTQILADAGNINTQIQATTTDYTSLLGALTNQQQLQSQNIQTAVNDISNLNSVFIQSGGLNYGGVAPGSDAIGNLLINQNAAVGSAIDNPSALLTARYIPGIDPNNLEHLSGVPIFANSTTLANLGLTYTHP